MQQVIDEILSKKDDSIKDFTGHLFTNADLNYLSRKINQNHEHVHFIKWHRDQKFSNDLKSSIQIKLVENILSEKRNNLVIDLTNCQVDSSFVKHLVDAVEQRGNNIGAIVFSESDEDRFRNDANFVKLMSIVKENNKAYRRFPNDYEYALLTCHCNNPTTVRDELARLGWEVLVKNGIPVKNSDQSEKAKDSNENDYLSILYKNDTKRRLVLAFRGIKLNHFKDEKFIRALQSTAGDFLGEKSILEAGFYGALGSEVTVHSYYASKHAREALKKSEEMGFYLSCTGYSFGAWLAEQSVYFCYIESPSASVRAVTFESPGSLDIIEHMNETNIKNGRTINDDPAKYLDVTTYLFAPNFLNTCHKHVGQVFRVIEKKNESRLALNSKEELEKSIDKESFPTAIWNKIINKLEKIGSDFIDSKVSKFYFYRNGIRALFCHDPLWLIDEFNSSTGRFLLPPKQVHSWPKIDFHPHKDSFSFKNMDIIGKVPFANIIPERLRNVLEKPFGNFLDGTIGKIAEKCFSGVLLTVNVILELASDDFNTDQMCSCIEFDRDDNLRLGQTIDPNSESNFMMRFKGHYQIKPFDDKQDVLMTSDHSHLDFRLFDFFTNTDRFLVGQLKDQFVELKILFEIRSEGEMHRKTRIESFSVSIEEIRERFLRLEKIYLTCQERLIPLGKAHYSVDSYDNNYDKTYPRIYNDFGGTNLDETYVSSTHDRNNFDQISTLLYQNGVAYIYGKSGYGKTTMARQYAHQASAKFLIQFIKSNNFNSNLTELGNRFLSKYDMMSAQSEQDIIQNIKKRLNSQQRPTLFIFDDVTSSGHVEPFIDSFGGHKFLITTKISRLFGKRDPNCRWSIPKLSFSEEECFSYLEKLEIPTKTKQSEWKWLIGECVNKLMVSIKDFENGIDYYRSHLFATFKDVFAFIENEASKKYKILEKENPKAFELITYLAYLHRDHIDLDVLHVIFEKEIDFLSESLDYLDKNGFLKIKNREYQKLEVEIHEQIQIEVNKLLCDSDKKASCIEKVLKEFQRVLNDHEDNNNRLNKSRIEKMNKHVINIDAQWVNGYKSKELSKLINSLAILNEKELKNYYDAINLMKIEKKNANERKNSEENLEQLEKIISLFKRINREHLFIYHEQFTDSKIFYNEFLDIERKKQPKNEQIIAEMLHEKGLVYSNLEKFDIAFKYYEESLELKQKQRPPNEKSIAITLNALGRIYRHRKDFDNALKYYNNSLAITKNDDESIAIIYHNIAQVYLEQNKLQDALVNFETSLNLNRKQPSKNEKIIAETLNEIGRVHFGLDNFDMALDYYKESLELKRKQMPLNEESIAVTLHNAGQVHLKRGRLDEALTCFNESFELNSIRQFKNERTIAETLNEIGEVYLAKQNFVQAQEYFRNSLNLKRNQEPPDEESIAITSQNLHDAYNRLNGNISNYSKFRVK